jgi:glycerophosphoryl diester phosphodiesterase
MTYLRKNEFALIAHRGGPLGHPDSPLPENTLFTFERALKLNSRFIFELDVHESRDGEIVVIHDDSVDRTTGGTGKIKGLPSKEIVKLDAGRGTIHQNTKIPLLKEVFSAFPQARVSIDLKTPGYERKVIQLIEICGAEDRVVLASENASSLRFVRRLAPHLCTGFGTMEVAQLLAATKLNLPLLAPRAGNVFQIPLRAKNLAVYSKRLLNLAHSLNKHVHIWTINEESQMQELIGDGVNGLVTDNPGALLKVAMRLQIVKENQK